MAASEPLLLRSVLIAVNVTTQPALLLEADWVAME